MDRSLRPRVLATLHARVAPRPQLPLEQLSATSRLRAPGPHRGSVGRPGSSYAKLRDRKRAEGLSSGSANDATHMAEEEPRALAAVSNGAETREKKPSLVRRALGRSVRTIGDVAKAVLGPQAQDLQANLYDLEEYVRGSSSDAKGANDVVDEPCDDVKLLRHTQKLVAFETRVEVTRELVRLVPDIMKPNAWGHVFQLSQAFAGELLQIVKDDVPEQSPWRTAITDCEGRLRNLSKEIEALQLLAPANQPSPEPAQVEAARSSANRAFESLVRDLIKLVQVRDEYALRAPRDSRDQA